MPRYMRKGITRFFHVPTIASATLVPTAAEVTAGDELTDEIAEVNGFSFANQLIRTPDMGSTYPTQITGEDNADDSSMTFYELRGGISANPIQSTLAKGTGGYIVIFYDGTAGANPAAGDDADVWPIVVASNSRQYTAANEAGKYMVTFAISAQPGFDKTLT